MHEMNSCISINTISYLCMISVFIAFIFNTEMFNWWLILSMRAMHIRLICRQCTHGDGSLCSLQLFVIILISSLIYRTGIKRSSPALSLYLMSLVSLICHPSCHTSFFSPQDNWRGPSPSARSVMYLIWYL